MIGPTMLFDLGSHYKETGGACKGVLQYCLVHQKWEIIIHGPCHEIPLSLITAVECECWSVGGCTEVPNEGTALVFIAVFQNMSPPVMKKRPQD
jgi:hypothetical protein